MVKIIDITTKSSLETLQLGSAIADKLKPGNVIAFCGDLGAGKTTLIKGIVNKLSKDKNIYVTSPTFIYLNIYDISPPVYHFDLYRIKNKNHFFAMGFEEYFLSDGICLIEWSENIKEILPPDTIKIKIKHINETGRSISISNLAID